MSPHGWGRGAAVGVRGAQAGASARRVPSVEEVISGHSGERLPLKYAILWSVYILRARLVPG